MDNRDVFQPGYVIRDVTSTVGDGELKMGLSSGWYMTQLRTLLDKLAFTLHFDQVTLDKDYPANHMLTVPDGLWDLQELYLWDGDEFSAATSTPVWWKRRLNQKPFGEGWTAMRTRTAAAIDPFNYKDYFVPPSWIAGMAVYYANISNGVIQFDADCQDYPKVRMVYSGSFGAMSEVPCIPRVFYDVCRDWLMWKWHGSMASRFPRRGYENLEAKAKNDLFNIQNGTWWAARKNVLQMDKWQRNAMGVYSDRGNW